jgi:hypothetical protein
MRPAPRPAFSPMYVIVLVMREAVEGERKGEERPD